MNTGLKVLDAMTKNPVAVSSNDSIHKVAEKMKKEGVGSVIVQNKGKLSGILSEQDLVYRVIAQKLDTGKTKVKDIMTQEVVTIEPDVDITKAMLLMNKTNVRRLPVIEKGAIVGLITMKDVLKVEPELFELVVDKLDLREEQRKPIHNIGEREGICQLCGNYTDFLFDKDDVLVCLYCR